MDIERITPHELKAMLDDGENVTVIDVRSSEAYDSAHISGAINITKDTVAAARNELSTEGKLVFY